MRLVVAVVCSCLLASSGVAQQIVRTTPRLTKPGAELPVDDTIGLSASATSVVPLPHLGVAPLDVRLEAADAREADTCIWDFGDGSTGVGRVVQHTYASQGSYIARVTIPDQIDPSHTITGTVTITVADGTYDFHGPVTPNEARRFLWQAGFGPTPADVNFIVANGYEAWIDSQRGKPSTIITPQNLADSIARGYGLGVDSLFDDLCVEAPDQLRQKMAWALLQILVMNDPNPGPVDCIYYSGYIQNALGNYRDLLDLVTRSHPMGFYLTYANNFKYNPETGAFPDENFARELMQLFTIGLYELNPDGTFMLDENGQRIPTYDNTTVQQFARVFTGFGSGDYTGPMQMYPDAHEFGSKQLLVYPGVVPEYGFIPQTDFETFEGADADIEAGLDNVFNHPNLGPFIAQLLIKRMTTSNPTPQYVARVARALEGTGPYGFGVRGDLFAAAKAILLDPEARDPAYRTNPLYGKLKEPLAVRWGMYRAFQRVDRPAEVFPFRIAAESGFLQSDLGESFMGSPTVFNFYLPAYIPPNTRLARAGMTAPELQICNDYTALAMIDRFRYELVIVSENAPRVAAWRAMADNVDTLVNALNDELACGALSPKSVDIIKKALGKVTGSMDRVRSGVWLVTNAPEFRVLK